MVGLVTTLRALPHSRRAHVDDTRSRVVTVVIYALIAFVGLVPEVGQLFHLKAIQVEAMLLILLVLSAHGLVWRFMTSGPMPGRTGDESRRDEPRRDESGRLTGSAPT